MISPQDLPPRLAERTRSAREGFVPGDGTFVLYWMRTAVRDDENPALEAALAAADGLDRPLFIYHALSERYPYASDRHHTFILEGARDVQLSLGERGIGYAFHLERPGHRGPHLRSLAARAALVVTEDMPVRPLSTWTAGLASSGTTPVWLVDTACVVPMRLVGKAYDRAFAYRRATERLRRERISLEWIEAKPRQGPFVPDLPFDPVDLQGADLAALVALCEIDHTVGPVPGTRGGSRAGSERWQAFRREKIARYAADRNDPLRDGVSRMSPYLHYGNVSPFRLAREALAVGGKGPEKFLDELLVWREVAYAYCFHREDHDSLSTLPGWARETLAAHESDSRPEIFSWESLARAKTGDRLWDAAQRSLLIHGELHNNVRMTWGKALLSWTPDTRAALGTMIDLNHRFALDGRDPASYGGILWCLGQFDRPFPPERPILGSVRPRPTDQHARRLDLERYERKTSEAIVPRPPRVAVVGAGVAGLVCARSLHDHGLPVTVFDKGARPGGRLATREAGELVADHGAQYFTVRDRRFRRRVDSWLSEGLVAEWKGRIVSLEDGALRPGSGATRRYVGVPGMNTVAAHLAADLDVRGAVTVRSVMRREGRWLLEHDGGVEGPWDAVVVAVPAPQAAPLLVDAPELRARVDGVRMNGCWAVLARFDGPLDPGFDGAFVNGGPLSWIARNGSKPGRTSESWVLHARPEWTREHLDDDPRRVAEDLLEAFSAAVRVACPRPLETQAHRWRHALPVEALSDDCLFDDALGLAVCGDWCAGPRVEGAFLSGSAAAGRLLSWTARKGGRVQGSLFPDTDRPP